MQQVITIEFALILLTLVTAVAGAWWRIENRVDAAKREAVHAADLAKQEASTVAAAAAAAAALAQQQLHEFKLHVAETYASKSGMKDLGDRVMQGQDRVLDEITRLHERMDRIIEVRDPARPGRGPAIS